MALKKIGTVFRQGGKLKIVLGYRDCPVCRDKEGVRETCPSCNGDGKVERIGNKK